MQTEETNDAYLRLSQIVPAILPVSRVTVWRWIKAGRFPAPLKLGDKVVVWKVSTVREWMATSEKGSSA